MKRKYDTSGNMTKPGVEVSKIDWKEMRKIAKEKGILVWAALGQAIRDWNKKHKGD